MKHQVKTLFLLSFLFWGCDSVENNISKSGVIRGYVSFEDVINDEVILDNVDILAEIQPISDEEIPRNATRNTRGSYFEFGPLPFGKYDIDFTFRDSLTGIIYKKQLDNLELSSDSISVLREVKLTPMDQTVIIASVTTPNDRPVENANVFLYSDATLLKTYQGAGGFVDSGVTNRLGKAAFVNHAPGDYYLYPELVIEDDTLTSNVTNLTPQSVSANTLNEITVQLEF